MGIKQDADELMSGMRVTGEMYRGIMESVRRSSNPAKDAGQEGVKKDYNTQGGFKMKDQRKFSFKKAAIPAAAALLVGSTMYVGAGYIMERLPLRELFAGGQDNMVTVPESQRMPGIYGEIEDPVYSTAKDLTDPVPGDGISGGTEGTAGMSMGKYGELIIDNELFSIELLENICTGRELSLSYILTYKTEEHMPVNVSVETDYYGELLDGPSDVPADSSRLLIANGFEERLDWKQLPENSIYVLDENQELRNYTQLAKEDYVSGIYQLYAEYHMGGDSVTVDASTGEASEYLGAKSEDTGHTYFKAPVEIISNDNYGIALNGSTDKTEGDVHFDTYEVYVSPWNVYLSLAGTYQGEISAIWGAKSSHEITIGFQDGTKAHTTVRLTGMGYGFGDIDVDMRASFDTSIDPEAIVSIMLDDVMIMGE